MGRRKLSEEERIKSREKRLEYLRNYRKEHGMEYYKENKERNKNYKFIGIEMNKEYCKIAEARMKYVAE